MLLIDDAQPDDSDVYKCQAKGPDGQQLESETRISVTLMRGPPIARIEPEDQTIGQGGSLSLRCTASGNPPITLTWSKVGEDLSSPNIVVSDQNSVLSIQNAQVYDRGMYMCTAQNPGGSARSTSVVEIERREPPRIEIYPDSTQTVTKFGSVLFQCRTLSGIPTPTITWLRKDGRPLEAHIEILRGGVMTSSLKKSFPGCDQGGICCMK